MAGQMPCLALAQTQAGATPTAVTAAARAEFSQGVARAKQGDWEAAYSHFLAAWNLKRHPQIALNLAHAELRLGKYKDSLEHLDFVLQDSESSAPDRSSATAALAEAKANLGKLQIDGSPPGARVLVDGSFVGKLPLREAVPVDPGAHKVELRVGDARTEAQVSVTSGQTGSVSLRLRSPEPVSPTAAPSSTATVPEAGVSPGLLCTTILVAGGGLTLAGLGVGIGAATTASERRGTVQRLCPTMPCSSPGVQGIENQWATLSNVSAWAFIGAGLAAAGTVTLVLVLPGPSSQKKVVRLAPWGAGMAAEASW